VIDAEQILKLAEAQRSFVVDARHHLHRNPELSFEEHETAAFVATHLTNMGYEPRTGLGRTETGLVATLDGDRPGPTLALRADMDALPVVELNDLPFRSCRDGIMHACGHDAHTAILLGAAQALMAVRDEVPGRVVFLFQHAEESPPGGALELIEAGALDGVDAVFGLHQTPMVDVGRMEVGPGANTASSDRFTLTVYGKGGHAARPHTAVDAIFVAGHVVNALHHIVSRRVNPMQPAVLTIGMIQGGTRPNVIAHEVTIQGTVRTLDEQTWQAMPREIETVARGAASMWGADITLDYRRGYPALINEARMAQVARRAAELVVGPDRVGPNMPGMGGEDFAHYLRRVPGCFVRLGGGTPGTSQESRGNAHSGAFTFDDAALTVGVAWFLSLVINFQTFAAE
jgi:amidohydrolase